MIITKKTLARRTFLRGVGVTLSLPFLDAMVPALTLKAAALKPTPRLGFFYIPNGIHLPNWSPKGDGAAFEISPTLTSLAPFKNQLIVYDGLANHEASRGTGMGLHAK